MLSESLLEECTICYLIRPVSNPSWFKRSLSEATTPCRDAVWALVPLGEQFQLFRPLLEYGGRVAAGLG